VVAHSLHVHRDAVRRADLVLAAIEATDGGRVIVVRRPVPGERVADGLRRPHDLLALLEQREHRHRDGRQLRVQAQHDALLPTDLFLPVGIHQEGQERPVHPR
jgi:hypothetical protein